MSIADSVGTIGEPIMHAIGCLCRAAGRRITSWERNAGNQTSYVVHVPISSSGPSLRDDDAAIVQKGPPFDSLGYD